MTTWRKVAVWATGAAWALGIITQAVAGDFLPPRVSVSQYGLGRNGWLFTAWTLAVAVVGLALIRARQRPVDLAATLIAIGSVGVATMGIVRTDANGLQRSLHARIHLGASVLVLVAFPVGFLLVSWSLSRPLGRLAVGLVTVSAVSLALLLAAAAGVNTAGGGPRESWAFWQSVAIVAEMVLLTSTTWAVISRGPSHPLADSVTTVSEHKSVPRPFNRTN